MPIDPEELESRIADSDEVLSSDGSSDEPDAQLRAAEALQRKAEALFELRRGDEAVVCWSQVTSRGLGAEDPDLYALAVEALGDRARALGVMKRYPEADRAFADLAALRTPDDDARLELLQAIGLYDHAWFLHRDGLEAPALARLDEFLHRHGDEPPDGREDLVLIARALRSATLWRLDRADEAIAAHRGLVDEYAGSTDSAVRLQLARAMREHARLARRRDRSALALRTYGELHERFDGAYEQELETEIALTMAAHGQLLAELERYEEAIAVHDQLVLRFAADPPDGVPAIVPGARYAKAFALRQIGRTEEALAVCRDLIEQYGSGEAIYARESVISAIAMQRNVAAEAREIDRVLVLTDALLDRLAAGSSPEHRIRVAQNLVEKSWWLLRTERSDEALAVAEQLLGRFRGEEDEETAQHIGIGVIEAAGALLDVTLPKPTRRLAAEVGRVMLGAVPIAARRVRRARQAERMLQAVIDRFRGESDPMPLSLAVEAEFHQGWALVMLGRPRAAWRRFGGLGESPARVAAFDAWARRAEQRSGRQLATVVLMKALTGGG